MLRIDRFEEAKRAGVAIMAGGTKINVPADQKAEDMTAPTTSAAHQNYP